MTHPSDTNPKSLDQENKLVRAILYGDFGKRKTTLAGLIAKIIGGKSLVVTADSCWSALYAIPDLQIDRIPYKSRESKLRTKTTFGLIWDIVDRYGDAQEYTTLILDPFSTMVEISVRHWVRVKEFTDQRDRDVASWTHYALVRNKLADVIEPLQATNLNIIYVTHLREPSDEEKAKGKILARPSLPEACYRELAKECNLIGLCFKEKTSDRYKIQTEGTTREAAKSQITTVPQSIFNQEDIPGLIKKWRES